MTFDAMFAEELIWVTHMIHNYAKEISLCLNKFTITLARRFRLDQDSRAIYESQLKYE